MAIEGKRHIPECPPDTVAGAIEIEEYRTGLIAAGLTHVQVIDSGSDLIAYTKAGDGAGCCSPSPSPDTTSKAVAQVACCNPKSSQKDLPFHKPLADLLGRYDVNDYAASVKVYSTGTGLIRIYIMAINKIFSAKDAKLKQSVAEETG